MLALSGTVDRLHLGDLLEWLHLSRQSGRLLLTAGNVTRAFDFVRGHVAFASSSRASERLASWLLRKGIVERPRLLRALAMSQTRGDAFTAVLEREAGVDHPVIVNAGRSLATALASRVMHEDRVTFTFDQSWPVTENLHIDLEIESAKLVMEAAFRMDTKPPADQVVHEPLTTLDPPTIEELFWRIVEELSGELADVASLAESHRTLLAVGELLHRWVTQGPPLLPLGPVDVARVSARLELGEPVRLEDSPTLTWDLLSLVNGLDAPGFSRASSADEAWLMAGADAPFLVRLVLENSRWRRDRRGDSDEALRRATMARAAAGGILASAIGLPADVAATAAALPVIVLELVATALASAPLASPAMQRAALRHLVPLVGHAAGGAAGLPEVLVAGLTGAPARHPGARIALLAGRAAEFTGVDPGDEDGDEAAVEPELEAVLGAARDAAQLAARAAFE